MKDRALSSVVERFVYIEDVRGSSPLVPTDFLIEGFYLDIIEINKIVARRTAGPMIHGLEQP
jgi:hypothetical protein